MKIPVLVHAENATGFRAEILSAQSLCAVGPTVEAALENLRGKLQDRLDHGARIAGLELAESQNPWLQLIGVYKDDPYLDEYKQAIADYRKQVDEDPERL